MLTIFIILWFVNTYFRSFFDYILLYLADMLQLVLQGWDDPYVTRTHEGLLKWKYPEMNSVDFLFEVLMMF